MTTRLGSWVAPFFISLFINILILWLIQVLTYMAPPEKTADYFPIQLVPLDTTPAPEIVKLEPDKPLPLPSPSPTQPVVRKSAPPSLPVKTEAPVPPAPAQTVPQVEELGLDEIRPAEPDKEGESAPPSPGPSPSPPGHGEGIGDTSAPDSSEIGNPFVPISRLTKIPTFVFRMAPVYPERSRIAGKEASVMAEIDLDAKGSIIEIRIIKSGGKDFDLAVKNAIMASSFTPGFIKDQPVPVRVQIPYVFKLR